jgi:PST family polysaccharide transporter
LINKLRLLFLKGWRSSIGRNVASLYVLQFANYIFPLITVPYLVRVLGPEKFGTVTFAQGLIAYFNLLVEYGFNWSATRKISVQRDDLEAVSHTASSVWAAKALLCGVGFLLLVVLVNLVPRLKGASTLVLMLYGTVVGNALFPTWLFQGLERMVAISVINLVVRALFTGGVLLLVRQSSDYLAYAGLLSFQSLAAGGIAIGVAYRSLGLQVFIPSWKGVKNALTEGWTLFLSKGAVSLYTAGNAFILGLLTNNTIVGYYGAAEKLIKSVQRLLTPISQAVYPRFSRLAEESRASALRWGRKMLLYLGGVGLIMSCGLLVGAPVLVRIILGPGYEQSIVVVRILAVIPFLVAVSNVLGVQIMFPFHRDKDVTKLTFVAGFINLLLAILLTPRYQASGIAMAIAASELFVSVSYMIYCHFNNLNPF